MSNKLDLEDIKEKMQAKLEPSGWARILKGYIYSKDFDDVVITLAKQVRDGKRFTPTMKNWFRALEECPYDNLKVVIVGQDPYPTLDIADGIAFSHNSNNSLQPSIKYILDAIEREQYPEGGYRRDPDLTRWSNQGVLLINTALTTTVNKVGQHYLIWKPFIAYLFDWLSWHNPGLVYIFMGKKASEWADTINDNCHKFHLTHPAAASYNNYNEWYSDDVFTKTKKIVKDLHNFDLIW
jgi:uracil-DNA glycosylase